MNRRKSSLLIAAILLLGFIFQCFGGAIRAWGTPLSITAAFLLTILYLFRRRSGASGPAESESSANSLIRQAEKEINEAIMAVPITALGAAHRKSQWQEIESVVDDILEKTIRLISSHINAHTVAVFFPTADGGYRIRKYRSSSEHINPEAIIYPGVGVIGAFLKNGLKQLNLQEIMSDSMTLYYYNRDAGIRSLMASPVIAGATERGTIIVDSTNKKNFTDEDHAYLSTIASVMGQAVFYAYLHTEHRIEHFRMAAMSSIEKEFFRNLKLDTILDKMEEIIPFAIPCDRLTLSIKNEDGRTAKVMRAFGEGAGSFKGKQFPLSEKTLASLLYTKNMCFFRDFAGDHYEVRYMPGEPQNDDFRSFLAIPIGVDDCKGMILAESYRKSAFTESARDLLIRIAISAGLAIEKILLIEKANNIATHDGLTGLYNHRQFQQFLKDEITRSIRYNDPLALVLCDIDFFKKCNDTYGHQFGDIVLKGVASKLESSVRDGIDTASRYGGEEFALVLVKTDEKNASETVERIRQQIANITFKSPTGDDVKVTMSFGIAIYRQHAKHLDELIKKADKALYRAKENGRNRVEVF
jgi:diguanylate cyclase (GGDEF)-like protein